MQWAVVMAEAVFKLLDPKETRSLEIVGLKVDPSNPKTPLFYRLEAWLRKEMSTCFGSFLKVGPAAVVKEFK